MICRVLFLFSTYKCICEICLAFCFGAGSVLYFYFMSNLRQDWELHYKIQKLHSYLFHWDIGHNSSGHHLRNTRVLLYYRFLCWKFIPFIHKNFTYILLIDVIKGICHIASSISKGALCCYIKDKPCGTLKSCLSNEWFSVCMYFTNWYFILIKTIFYIEGS